MSQVTVTTATLPVTVVCPRALLIPVTATLASTSVSQITLGQHDMVLPLQLISRGTMRGSAGPTTMLQQHPPQSQMPSQAY